MNSVVHVKEGIIANIATDLDLMSHTHCDTTGIHSAIVSLPICTQVTYFNVKLKIGHVPRPLHWFWWHGLRIFSHIGQGLGAVTTWVWGQVTAPPRPLPVHHPH